MAKKPTTDERRRQWEWLAACREILVDRPVITLDDLDAALYERFKAVLSSRDHERVQRGHSRGRTRWENLVDWCKANLTQEGSIRYLHILGVRHVVYLPPAGHVERTLCWSSDAWGVAGHIVAAANRIETPAGTI